MPKATHTISNNSKLMELRNSVLREIKSPQDLIYFKTSLDSAYYNRKLANIFLFLNKTEGWTLDSIIEKFNLPFKKSYLSLFITRYSGEIQ